jgi:multidrug efflux system outer membrane protein
MAVERITEAQANAGLAASGDLPQISVSAQGGRSDPTGASALTAGSASANVSWMIDLFGRNASARAASGARLDAAYASADVARIAMAGAVAQAYVDLRYYQGRMALTRDSKISRQKTADLIRSAFAAGSATKLDTLRADQLIAITDAQLPALELGYAQSLNRFATLTGQPAASLDAILRKGAAQPVPHFRASVGVPADVLRARPDVIAAERSYAAAMASVGVAKADLYPSLALGGMVTASGVQGAASATTWSFGPTLNLPIFSGGAVRANLSAAESRARQAQLGLQTAVLNAVEEIQNALAAYSRDGRNMAAQQKLMDISSQTLDLARSSFQIGQGDFLSVLEAERTLLDARGALADANRARAQNFIRLSMATADGAMPQ